MKVDASMGLSLYHKKAKEAAKPKGQLMISGKTINHKQRENEDKEQIVQASGLDASNNQVNQRKEKQDVIQEALKNLQEAILGEDNEERYQEILKKAEDGEDLSEKDLAYLKSKNPKAYYEVKSEMMVQKQFEERLKHCKSKEEANDAYILTVRSAEGMCGLKGHSSVKPNGAKFKRLMKRINKIWEKYKKGELGQKEKVDDVSSKNVSEGKNIGEDKNISREQVARSQYIKAVDEFQQEEDSSSDYDRRG